MDSKQSGYEQERLNILRMVEEGKLSANEAAGLLSALSQEKAAKTFESVPRMPETPEAPAEVSEPVASTQQRQAGQPARWFRIRVTDISSGRAKATINLPIGLVNWGMKIGARYAPEVEEFDFNELSQMLQVSAEGKLIDVMDEEDGEHVEIFVD
jgi:hypothetical protein